MTKPKVVLIGPMGAGKTTVGALLAERWGVGVRDTDTDVETSAGKSVQDIFVDDGETAFRAMEREAVATALLEHDGVLALGGGAVLAPETRAQLSDQTVVFLKVAFDDAVRRVGSGDGRPLLLGNVRSRVKSLMEERTPIYEEVARYTVDTTGKDAADVAAEIAELLS